MKSLDNRYVMDRDEIEQVKNGIFDWQKIYEHLIYNHAFSEGQPSYRLTFSCADNDIGHIYSGRTRQNVIGIVVYTIRRFHE